MQGVPYVHGRAIIQSLSYVPPSDGVCSWGFVTFATGHPVDQIPSFWPWQAMQCKTGLLLSEDGWAIFYYFSGEFMQSKSRTHVSERRMKLGMTEYGVIRSGGRSRIKIVVRKPVLRPTPFVALRKEKTTDETRFTNRNLGRMAFAVARKLMSPWEALQSKNSYWWIVSEPCSCSFMYCCCFIH